MKFAPIPPIPNLSQFQSTGINLLLAHLLTDKRYFQYYRQRYLSNDFNILDNGAHENEAFEFVKLLKMSMGIAHEVVIPDVPHDAARTLENFTATLSYLNTRKGKQYYDWCRSPRLMFVPQIELEPLWLDDYVSLAHHMISMTVMDTWIEPSKFTLAIPLMYDKDPSVNLLDIVDRVSSQCDINAVPIHLLGWSRDMATPIKIANQYPSLVRSVDSAKPFVHARYQVKYDHFALQPYQEKLDYPGRPANYFTKALTPYEAYIGNFNSNVLQSLIFETGLPQLPEQNENDLPTSSGTVTNRSSAGLSHGARSETRDTP